MSSTKKNISVFIITIVIMSIISTAIYLVSRYSSHTKSLTPVTFRYNQVDGAHVNLYRGATKNLVKPEIQGDPVTIDDKSTHQLEDWPYVAIVDGDGIKKESVIIYPHQIPQTVTLSVSLLDEKLDTILREEEDRITQAILEHNPAIESLYEIKDIKAHGDGNWATARLYYTGNDRWSRDTLSVILKKLESKWTVAAGPAIAIHQSTQLQDAPRSLFWTILPEEVSAS